jgi:protein TonB
VEQPAVTPITRNSAPIPDTALAKVEPEPAGRSEEAERVEPEAPAPTVREASSQIAMAPRSAPATKTDYSWLAESLWRRVVELKRYPHEARLNRWEGKVVLKAVIREDGHLGDLQIQKSSGYDILDQDAMELVRKACPLHLKHPLGRPEVVVQIPINYALR